MVHGENGGREATGVLQMGIKGIEGGGSIWGVEKKSQVGKQGFRDR